MKLAPIEHDTDYKTRTYIPLPGKWEVQTKGGGSTFRIYDGNAKKRMPVADTYLHPTIEKMAIDIHAAVVLDHLKLREALADQLEDIEGYIVFGDVVYTGREAFFEAFDKFVEAL
jgi:hypothetical protein